jgi:signal transduction histidine kinase
MRRRLTIAILGTVITALVLAGLGTIVLGRFGARQSARKDLATQASALTQVFEEVDIARLAGGTGTGGTGTTVPPRLTTAAMRQRLTAITKQLKLEGVGIVFTNASYDTVVAGDMPPNISYNDVRSARYSASGTATGSRGRLVWAAARGESRLNLHFVLVLTGKPSSIIAPAWRWFLLASAGVVLLAVLVVLRVSRALAAPIVAASATAQRIAAGDLAARVPDSGRQRNDELTDLSRSINAMAETLDRARGHERQFLMSVSHDLRTPLTAISGYAEALTDEAIDPQRAGTIILEQSRRLDRLVTDLLLLARLEAQSFTLDLASVDAAGAVRQFALGFVPRAAERGLTLVVDTPPTSLPAVVDADRLGQIVANLTENALNFAMSRVEVRVRLDDGWVELCVADDGPGIAREDLPHVFERLYVARHRPTPKESGSGLGLAIVRELTVAMGGHVLARSPRADGASGTEMLVTLRPA